MILSGRKAVLYDYVLRILITLSVLLNVILGGYSNQTFSARNWAWKLEGKPNIVWLIDAIFSFDPNHCKQTWEYWILRKNFAKENNMYQ
jgi:hypothetical protein